MFLLKLYDRQGTELNEGDIVKISDGKSFSFYSEIKYLEKEEAIAPFHTFSFHSFLKVDKLPENTILSKEIRYRIWFVQNPELDESPEEGEKYLIDWRQCEHLLSQRCFRIKMYIKQTTLF
jgi:hypothetical protein